MAKDQDQRDDEEDDGPSDEDIKDLGEEHQTAACPNCGAEIYDDAEKCPKCGQYVTREFRGSRGPATVALVILVVLLVVAIVWLLVR
jgi:predicted nucleic acid-binding Zn ribbon protein